MTERRPMHKQRWVWTLGRGLLFFGIMAFALPLLMSDPMDISWTVISAVVAALGAGAFAVALRRHEKGGNAATKLQLASRTRRMVLALLVVWLAGTLAFGAMSIRSGLRLYWLIPALVWTIGGQLGLQRMLRRLANR